MLDDELTLINLSLVFSRFYPITERYLSINDILYHRQNSF